MKSLLLTALFLIPSIAFTCENMRYLEADTIVVSPSSRENRVLSFLPFRGLIDEVTISRRGNDITPFEVTEAVVAYRNGFERDLWFDRARNEEGQILKAGVLRRSTYDNVETLTLELENRSYFLRFYTVKVGKCMDSEQ